MKKIDAYLLVALTFAFVNVASAQTAEDEQEQSDNTAVDPAADLDIRVRKAGTTTVREFHTQGRIYKVEIAPENTPAYILSDQDGNGNLNSSDTRIDSDLVVPEWTIGNW